MARQRQLEIANFHLTFGEDAELLDRLDSVVLPAFQTDLRRKTSKATYALHDVRLLGLMGEDPAGFVISGRLVKDMKLRRKQIFTDEGELVEAPDELESAPSSLFMLRLLGHRLCYLREEGFSPTLSEFRTTMAFHLRNRVTRLVNELHEKSLTDGERIYKTVIRKAIGNPNLEVVHVGSKASVAEFVGRFDRLKKLTMSLVRTNAEIDLGDFTKSWRTWAGDLNMSRSKIEGSNNETGLNKTTTVNQLSAAKEGNATVSLSGTDEDGRKITGTNEDMSVRVPIDAADADADTDTATAVMFDALTSLIDDGVIEGGPTNEEAVGKLAKFQERFMQWVRP